MQKRLLAFFVLISASLACNLPGAASPAQSIPPTIDIPTFTPTSPVPVAENKPTELPAPPAFTPESVSPTPQARALNPRALAGCDIFLDTDFPNAVGAIPTALQSLSEDGKVACQYTFENGSILVYIVTNMPGMEAFQNVRQFDAISGGTVTPYPLGEAAVFKTFDPGRVALEAVLNGWYVVFDAQGFDEKNLVLLAELLLDSLSSY